MFVIWGWTEKLTVHIKSSVKCPIKVCPGKIAKTPILHCSNIKGNIGYFVFLFLEKKLQ
jgi:hypothetical protein